MFSNHTFKMALNELIEDLQPHAFTWHEGIIDRHNFTLVIEEAAKKHSTARQLAVKAIELGEKQFKRDWATQDTVIYHNVEQSAEMRNVLEAIRSTVS